MILTYRQDDILLIKLPLKTPSHSFLLELLGDEWTLHGFTTNQRCLNNK